MVTLRIHRPARADVVRFLAIWLGLGFAMGTATLLGPVRWITDIGREAGWQPGAEDGFVQAVIVLYVALSFVCALWFTGIASRSGRLARWGLPLLTTGLAAAALGLWMSPTLVNGFVATPVSSVSRFTFGPYPDRARFEELRADGFTAVISLLHPAVVPFEPTLLARERALAEEFGIELVHAPMLPWIAENEESLAVIRELADSGRGKYYVHCYLGRDRVGMVKRLIDSRTGATRNSVEVATAVAQLREMGNAFSKMRFERGPIFELEEGVYVTPYPTDDEFVKYVLGGAVAHVVSLLDPANPRDRQWIETEEGLAESYGLDFTSLPITSRPFDSYAVSDAVERVRDLPRPVLVHAFRSEVGVADAFRRSWESGRPSVRVDLLDDPLAAGSARILAPHLIVGPRPAGPEFGSRLEAAGVAGVFHVGENTIDAVDDRIVVTTETGMEWRDASKVDEEVMRALARGGPWYVYGSDREQLVAAIAERLERADRRLLASGRK